MPSNQHGSQVSGFPFQILGKLTEWAIVWSVGKEKTLNWQEIVEIIEKNLIIAKVIIIKKLYNWKMKKMI